LDFSKTPNQLLEYVIQHVKNVLELKETNAKLVGLKEIKENLLMENVHAKLVILKMKKLNAKNVTNIVKPAQEL